jgi:hypothetical protein
MTIELARTKEAAAVSYGVFNEFTDDDWYEFSERLMRTHGWFSGDLMSQPDRAKFYEVLTFLHHLEPFTPPSGPLYRATWCNSKDVDLSPGQFVQLVTSRKRMQSWTEDLSCARTFYRQVGYRYAPKGQYVPYIVGSREASKYAIGSWLYFNTLMKKIAKHINTSGLRPRISSLLDSNLRSATQWPAKLLDDWKSQREVICYLPESKSIRVALVEPLEKRRR